MYITTTSTSKKEIMASPNAEKEKFEINRYESCHPFIIIYDGTIIEAGRTSWNDNFDITDNSLNWERLIDILFLFWRNDEKTFDEILGKLDKDTEEYKQIKCYMDHEISQNIDELKRDLEDKIRKYEELSKRLEGLSKRL